LISKFLHEYLNRKIRGGKEEMYLLTGRRGQGGGQALVGEGRMAAGQGPAAAAGGKAGPPLLAAQGPAASAGGGIGAAASVSRRRDRIRSNPDRWAAGPAEGGCQQR